VARLISLLILFSPFLSLAHIIQDDVAVEERISFSFKDVCTKSGFADSPLIEVDSGTRLDCMSKKVEVSDFCDKELASDPYYLRAYIDQKQNKVVCLTGKKVIFKYLCVKQTDKKLCAENSKMSCHSIQAKLAKRLDLVHHAVVKNDKGIPQLNCFFESLPLHEKSSL